MNSVENILALMRILALQWTQGCPIHPACRGTTGLSTGLWMHKINWPDLEEDKENEDETVAAW